METHWLVPGGDNILTVIGHMVLHLSSCEGNYNLQGEDVTLG